MGTAFTYQGSLLEGGSPANSSYDFQFHLHDDAVANSPIGSMQQLTAVNVSDGLFSMQLDFGDAAFDGQARGWRYPARRSAGGQRHTWPLS
jgi:hypothetical protein